MLGESRARDVDVGATVFRIGEQNLDGVRPFLLLRLLLVLHHQADIIGVAEAKIAFASKDRAGLVAVTAIGLGGQVFLHALQPFLGLLLAIVGDHRGDQRDVVHVLAAAHANLAFPLGVGELFIGDRVLIDAILGGVDDTATHGQAEPVTLGIAILLGDVSVDRLAFERLRNALFLGVDQATDVHGQNHVCRRILALGINTIFEPLVQEQHLGLDAGLFGKGVKQR